MIRRVLVTLVLLVPLATSASAQLHKDERLGFKIKPPRGWEQVPIQSEEQWITAKYFCNKPDFYTKSDRGYTYKHTSSLRVIAFVDQFINGEDEEDGGEKRSSGVFRLGKSYRGYKEYLKDNFKGGYFEEGEKSIERNGMQVTCREFRAEDGATGDGDRLIHTWVFETEIGEIAVEFVVLEDAYGKKKKIIEKTLKSFAAIPRTQPLVMTGRGSEWFSSLMDSSLTPKKREERRRAAEARLWAAMKSGLSEGWEAHEIRGIKILTRHDERHAKAVAGNIRAVMTWMDETFPTIGPEEYVRFPVVRICKNFEEKNRFRSGSGFGTGRIEIVTHKDSGGAAGFEWEYINNRAKEIWFYERDRDLYWALPAWLRYGLEEVIESAKVKGSQLKFYRDDWELAWRDDQDPWGLERVFTMSRQEFLEEAQRSPRSRAQSVTLTRFLISGSGSKGKYKGLLNKYILNVKAIIEELDGESKTKSRGAKRPQTEKGEDAELKARRASLAKREDRILRLAYDRTFGSLSAGSLASLKKAYLKEVR